MSLQFDPAFYLLKNPDIAKAGIDPLFHFTSVGFLEGRNPNPFFDTAFYLVQNPDVKAAKANPLDHFNAVGFKENRDPNPFFDLDFYLSKNPDVAKAGANPLEHFANIGFKEGRDPNPFFDLDFYASKNPDVSKAGVNPLLHFQEIGFKEGRDPNPFFDTDFYLKQNPDVAKAGINPLDHFQAVGFKEARNPSPFFDTSFYLKNNADVALAGINPLQHFFGAGVAEFRNPAPGVDLGLMKADPTFAAGLASGDFFKVIDRIEDIAPFLPTFVAPAGFNVATDAKSFPTGFVPFDPNFKLVIPEGFVPPAGAVIDKFFDLPNTFTLPPGVALAKDAEIPPNLIFNGGDLPPGFIAPPGFKLADGFVPPPDFSEFKDIVLPPGFAPPPGFDPNLLPPGFDPNAFPPPGGGGGGSPPPPGSFPLKFGAGAVAALKGGFKVDLTNDATADNITQLVYGIGMAAPATLDLSAATTMLDIKNAVDAAAGLDATLAGSVLTVMSATAGVAGNIVAPSVIGSPPAAKASFKLELTNDAAADGATSLSFNYGGTPTTIDLTSATTMATLKTLVDNDPNLVATLAGSQLTVTGAAAGAANDVTAVMFNKVVTPAVAWISKWVIADDANADQITEFKYKQTGDTNWTTIDTSAATSKTTLATAIDSAANIAATFNGNDLELKAEVAGAAKNVFDFQLTRTVPATPASFKLDLVNDATADAMYSIKIDINGPSATVFNLQANTTMAGVVSQLNAHADIDATLVGSVVEVKTATTGMSKSLGVSEIKSGAAASAVISGLTDGTADGAAEFKFDVGTGLKTVDVTAATTVATLATTINAFADIAAVMLNGTSILVFAENPGTITTLSALELKDGAFADVGSIGAPVNGVDLTTFANMITNQTPGADAAVTIVTPNAGSPAAGLDAITGPYAMPTDVVMAKDAGMGVPLTLTDQVLGKDATGAIGPFPAHASFATPTDTQFTFGSSKFTVQDQAGMPVAAPSALFVVAVTTATTAADVPAALETAAGGDWGASKAYLVDVQGGGAQGIYLFVNDGVANRDAALDIFVEVTLVGGGVLPAAGATPVNNWFL